MFTMNQKIWIVIEGVKLVSPVKIKREFLKKFNISPNDSKKLHGHQFVRVLTNFKTTGSVKKEKPKKKRKKNFGFSFLTLPVVLKFVRTRTN